MTKPKQYRSLMLLLPILALMLGMAGRVQAKMIDGIVAVVDNKIIMDSDLRKKMIELGAPMDSKAAERQVLELMVEDIVIEKIYKAFGLPPVNEADAKKASTDLQCDMETAKGYIMKSTLMDMMVRSRVVVTENMIRSYYDSHREYQGKNSVRLKQIVVSGNDAKMQQVMADLKSGMSFDDAAKKYSEALSVNGADIGWIAVDDLSDEVMDRLESAKPGDTVGPITTSPGARTLYQLTEKKVIGAKNLKEVRGEIKKTLERKHQQEAFEYWLHKTMTQYFIGIYI